MCHEPGALPPLPPVAGGSGATTRELTLTSADGEELGAFSAVADGGPGPGMVVLPDVRGLHDYYRDLAVRFAEAGIHATAIDYFGRTAGIGSREDDFDFWPHVRKTRSDQIAADTAAAAAHLRSGEGGGATAVFTVGFCFGGRNSFNQAARRQDLAGVIGFYGRVTPREEGDADAPIDRVSKYACPVLGLFGGDDQGIPREDVERFRQALDAAGIENEIQVYEGAPHSFFDRSFEQHRDACDDAWRRVLAFVQRHRDG
ncbi:MAG: dienelactone hydrolase family protein [Actinomycetota bacterium]